ncbi:MAG TPA: adenylosuccinate lyase [Acidimicrobiales bacterium]|nr:adenylosuccinate lyase [Acidimicrobiales bacterium]
MPALSPLDGRYAPAVAGLAEVFSEDGLFKQRLAVEVEWLVALADRPEITELDPLHPTVVAELRRWVDDFGPDDVAAIKAIEARTNHDVKAVEYHLKAKLAAAGVDDATGEFVHFACTSEDINNLAHTLALRDGLLHHWLPAADRLVEEVWALAEAHAALPMPSHTHGQPATPTTLGKELAVFVARWRRQLAGLRAVPLTGKMNGATGTFGAHQAAYPEVPWIEVSRRFVEGFGLQWAPLTTQIEPHDALAEVLHAVVRTNTVLLDFCRDLWEYVSRGYLRQQAVAGEVGSSTMPHKVNPIDFENAEANVGISTALAEHLATKLMASRMQRDLTDSSAIRNVGVVFGHSLLALTAARRGLGRVAPDAARMAAELDGEWEVLAEAVQTVMRRHGLPEPYERLKELTRGASVDAEQVRRFVASLGLPPEAEERLARLTPAGYVGLAPELVAFAAPPTPR